MPLLRGPSSGSVWFASGKVSVFVFSLADSGMVDMGLCEVISTSESTASVAKSK